MNNKNDENTLTDYKENIFDFIYVAAIRDATTQGAYKGDKKWMWEKKEKSNSFKNENCNDIASCLQNHITLILTTKIKSKDDYNSIFLKLACQICEKINKTSKRKFTFGNAQKLINMTVKYYYIICYIKDELRDHFEFCHCPMDKNMLDQVWNENDPNLRKKYNKTQFCKSWSSIDFEDNQGNKTIPDRYLDFQNCIQSRCGKDKELRNPIEYDYKYW